MKRLATIACVWVLAGAGTAGRADWDPGEPFLHTPQLPDESPTGIDVDTTSAILADDFKARETALVGSIHVWGSFADDTLPIGGVGSLEFRLSLHDDLPDMDGPGPDFGKPGMLLWEEEYDGFDYEWRLWKEGVDERFWDPTTNTSTTDTNIYQFNFELDPANPFTVTEDTIYWLDVQGLDPNMGANFGWKTSADHFNSAAVYGDGVVWTELRYPGDHSFAGDRIDMSFVLSPIPEPAPGLLMLIGAGIAFHLRRRRLAGSHP